MAPMTAAELWRRGQAGWPRDFPLVQAPNAPLLVAFAGWGIAAVSGGWVHDAGRVLFVAGIVVWACGEVVAGVNWVRRLLGAGVLVWLVLGAL